MLNFLPKGCKNEPIDNTFRLIGKKFTVHILRNMIVLNQNRFNELLNSIEGINPNTLSARLRGMEEAQLIEKKVTKGNPVKIEYKLTKKGKMLQPILEEMAKFSMKFCCEDIFKDAKPRTFRQVYGRTLPIID